MLARVSNIDAFRRWRDNEDQGLDDLIRFITVDAPTPRMLAGTAFHKALELAQPGEYDTLYADGYTFHLPEGTLALPTIRELRAFGNYGPLQVTGQVDGLHGKRVEDHKTTERFDAERYLEGYQWRYYLDLFGADVFCWNVFEIREVKPLVYHVADVQVLTEYRYPGMHRDCERLAAAYYEFAREHLRDHTPDLKDAA